ncbi:MAG: sensor histidine kinase KdpD [Planctomycetota bacterium]|nr:sensor histidine kinase KdpD [Planctomycetota bacterium]
MEPARPDPEQLLQRVKAEEQRQKRGRLKIFLGAAAGVGKTYAMLEAARVRTREGVDVMAGIVETHRRQETEALLEGLEILPPRFVEYRNTKLREFDLEAAIARRPALLLVDELAHTNAPGCKNAKRWQDVRDLLDAGVDVYATVNVQHVESLNDVVAQITGVVVRETIPDSVMDEADEVEVVDLLPDDLLQRLKEGKVYLGDQAERAAAHFFRKGNLIALRELALRCTADRVNRQVQSYRQERAISTTWPTAERILVCISPSPFSARVVRAARRMAAGLRAEWTAAYVETPKSAALPDNDRQQVKRNLHLAEQLGAETVTLSGNDVVEELLTYARKRNVSKIITGKPASPRWRERLLGSFVDDLIRRSGDIDVYVIKGDPESEEPASAYPQSAPAHWAGYGWAALTVTVCTLLAGVMNALFAPPNLVMVYLLGVVLVAARWGRGPAIFCSFASVAAFDFFFVPPSFSFAVSDTQYVVTFAVMLCVALVFSSLTVRIQSQAQAASLRERRTAALYAMARQLSSTRGTRKLLEVAARHVAEVFESDVVGLMPDADGRLVIAVGNESVFPFDARERGVAQWVFDTGHAAGSGTDTVPAAAALYVPLSATRGPVGVLGVHPVHQGRLLGAEQMHLLEAFASQTALAIECDRLSDEAQGAHLAAEAERSRNALLSSVSHDLRTPLAGICGAASSLLEKGDRLEPAARRELTESIQDEAERMARLVGNLLEMTKLDSGATRVRKEWCPLEEVVGGALTRLEKVLGQRRITTRIPADLPEVPLDVILVEQVFVNILENAAKYTPPGSPVDIVASANDKEVSVEIADCGPGLAPGDEKKVFEKFYRGKATGARQGWRGTPGGVGLGLAICRAIIEAHGGRISAANRPGGGAVFRFTLPLAGESPMPKGPPEEPAPDRE